MSLCNIPPEVLEYLELVESEPWRVCDEQKALASHIRRSFETEDICVDRKQLDHYLSLEKYFPFQLFPWEKFLTALWDCTYWKTAVFRDGRICLLCWDADRERMDLFPIPPCVPYRHIARSRAMT